MSYRITVDVGGTFTDTTVVDDDGTLTIGKSATTPDRAFDGIRASLAGIADGLGRSVSELVADCSVFVYSTTRATNAIIERTTARTAFLTTEGFPDILVLREGGKTNPFDLDLPYPKPYVPRRLTFEVPERITAEGEVYAELDEAALRRTLAEIRQRDVEAVAVCLLWSIVNPVHELRVGELIEEELPGVAYTLSHQVNPVVREYRRASATAIDASLKPLMSAHLAAVREDLEAHGFAGELLAATSYGGVMHLDDLARQPIYSVKSGPALAPVAGRLYAEQDMGSRDAIVCDMGGTSFDVSLVRDGEITFSRETWLGGRFLGDLIAISSVDVRSVGGGGGSIAWIDEGGLLRVGPASAGAVPGPACYGRGGDRPTVTDAAAVLGYLPSQHFLGGTQALDLAAAREVLERLAGELGLGVLDAAEAVLAVAAQTMVGAVFDITVNEGLDPRDSVFVAGGGAAGLTICRIVADVGSSRVLVPRTAGALSAVGGQFSDIVAEFTASCATDTAEFRYDEVNATLAALDAEADEFQRTLAARGITEGERSYTVEARYSAQVWSIDVDVPVRQFSGEADVKQLMADFDAEHERIFAVSQPGQHLEALTWRLQLRAGIGADQVKLAEKDTAATPVREEHEAYFPSTGMTSTPIWIGHTLRHGDQVSGPAIIVEPTSTLIVPPDWNATVTENDDYLLETQA